MFSCKSAMSDAGGKEGTLQLICGKGGGGRSISIPTRNKGGEEIKMRSRRDSPFFFFAALLLGKETMLENFSRAR